MSKVFTRYIIVDADSIKNTNYKMLLELGFTIRKHYPDRLVVEVSSIPEKPNDGSTYELVYHYSGHDYFPKNYLDILFALATLEAKYKTECTTKHPRH